MSENNFLHKDVLFSVILAVLYIIAGKISILLSIPVGYGTIVWPGSGIALGMLLIFGPQIWLGLFIGSFVLNLENARFLNELNPELLNQLYLAFFVASGVTLQALVGRYLINRIFGIPIRLHSAKQVALLALIAGPVSGTISTTVNLLTYAYANQINNTFYIEYFLTWWIGNTLGILVFTPLIILSPYKKDFCTWQGKSINSLTNLSLLILLIPIALTFYGWKISKESIYQAGQANFENLTIESEKALTAKINSYSNAILGGAGFFQLRTSTTYSEWKNYVESLKLENNFPGLNGIGWINPIDPNRKENYLKSVRPDVKKGVAIHPDVVNKPFYIISYIEPEDANLPAIGLNIAFEDRRREAAELSRDTGKVAITKPISLVQDEKSTPGFLILHPMYKNSLTTNSYSERIENFQGWVYAPLIANKFLENLTDSQGKILNIKIFHGEGESDKNLIYSSNQNLEDSHNPRFRITKNIDVLQQKWHIVWEGTASFEKQQQTIAPELILSGGLLFSSLFALYLIILAFQKSTQSDRAQGKQNYYIPALVFVIIASGSTYFYRLLKNSDLNSVKLITEESARNINNLVTSRIHSNLNSLNAMSKRWEAAEGTPFNVWKADSLDFIKRIDGLKAVEWIDNSYHVQWIEPLKENEDVIGLDIIFDKKREVMLKGASERNTPTVTPPFRLVQGFDGFITYFPLKKKGNFDGFIANVISVKDFFHFIVNDITSENFVIAISFENKNYYESSNSNTTKIKDFSFNSIFSILDQDWKLNLTPTQAFINEQTSNLPLVFLLGGYFVSLLSALLTHYTLSFRLKSAQLSRSSKKLNEVVNFQDIIFEAIPDFTFVKDEGFHIVQANKKFLQIYPEEIRDSVIGTTTFESYSKEEKDKFVEYDIKALNEGSAEYEELITFPNGSTQYLQTKKIRFYDSENKPFILGLSRDISDAKRQEIELDKARSAAVTASAAKSAFLANMSHEIRTPLTSIIGYAESGLDNDISIKERTNAFDKIFKNGKHLLGIINDILDISKIDAGALQIEEIEFSPVETVENIKTLLMPRAEEKGISLEVNYNWTLPATIKNDSLRLTQILVNLGTNAIKFTKKGHILIDVSCDRPNEILHFKISDSGIGLTAEQISRLFKPFSQADVGTTRQFGGTGLGLSISKQLVERLGGKITVESIPEKGSTFSFYIRSGSLNNATWISEIPCAENLSGPVEEIKEDLSGKILFADDSEDNRALVGFSLRKTGLDLTIVENGEEAVNAALNDKFDLILLDMQMPVMDGYTAARILRQEGVTIPIIAFTANAMKHDRVKCIEAGCNAHLSKPFTKSELFSVFQYQLANKDKVKLTNHIISIKYLEDPKQFDSINKFVNELSEQVSVLENAVNQNDIKKIQGIALDLANGADLNGYPMLSENLSRLVKTVEEKNLLESQSCMLEVISLSSRIEQGVREIININNSN